MTETSKTANIISHTINDGSGFDVASTRSDDLDTLDSQSPSLVYPSIPMPTYKTFVTDLLRTYHGRNSAAEERICPPDLEQVRYLCDVGLGPIAFRAYGDILRGTEAEAYSLLQSADLTTRVIYGQLQNATVELLGSLQDVDIRPVLLKGISTANEFYTTPHLRLMGDVDILVKDSETEVTMTKLADLGYETSDEDWQKYRENGHHHLPSTRNPNSGVTIEVHTDLFAPGEPFVKEKIFQRDSVAAQVIEFDYEGTPAARFTPEFQLVYTIAHWAVDGGWAMNLTSINDVVHILRKYESELDWSKLADWIAANPWLYPSTATLVRYLDKSDIVAMNSNIQIALAKSKVELQPATSKILLWLLHRQPFNIGNRTGDTNAMWRAKELWQQLTRPNSRDVRIPYTFLRTAIRTVYFRMFNKPRWLSSLYRNLRSRRRLD